MAPNTRPLNQQELSLVLSNLSKNEQFIKELESVSSQGSNGKLDKNSLETGLLSVFQKHLDAEKVKLGKNYESGTIDPKLLLRSAKQIANVIVNRQSLEQKSSTSKTDDSKNITKNSKEDFKKLVKYLAVYEIYKFLSPKKIAGETKKENFAHNVIIGGMERAQKYDGGSKSDIASYSPKLLNKLHVKNNAFKKSKGMIR